MLVTGIEKDDIEQGDLSFAWGLNDRLNILGRWNYDFYLLNCYQSKRFYLRSKKFDQYLQRIALWFV